MIPEKPFNIFVGVLLFVIMAYIGAGLAKQFDPEKLMEKPPVYTESYVRDLQRQKIYFEKQAHWYQTGWENLTRILGK